MMENEKQKNKRGFLTKGLYFCTYIMISIILLIIITQKLTSNEVSVGGYRIFRIISESMVPVYNKNDVILVKEKEPGKVKVGDDLTYLANFAEAKNLVITHRIVDIEKNKYGKYMYYTKGLLNLNEDPVVMEDQIYGTVVYKIHILSILSKIINNVYGFALCVFMPLLFLICVNIKELILSLRSNNTWEKIVILQYFY